MRDGQHLVVVGHHRTAGGGVVPQPAALIFRDRVHPLQDLAQRFQVLRIAGQVIGQAQPPGRRADGLHRHGRRLEATHPDERVLLVVLVGPAEGGRRGLRRDHPVRTPQDRLQVLVVPGGAPNDEQVVHRLRGHGVVQGGVAVRPGLAERVRFPAPRAAGKLQGHHPVACPPDRCEVPFVAQPPTHQAQEPDLIALHGLRDVRMIAPPLEFAPAVGVVVGPRSVFQLRLAEHVGRFDGTVEVPVIAPEHPAT